MFDDTDYGVITLKLPCSSCLVDILPPSFVHALLYDVPPGSSEFLLAPNIRHSFTRHIRLIIMNMAGIRHFLQLVGWMCLLGCSPTAGAVTDFETGIAEFSQIFPRNETYAPSLLFPFVFVFQNPAVARSMDPSVRINLLKWNESESDWEVTETTQVDTEKLANASDSEPFFAHHVYGETFNTEAYWTFSWTSSWLNCSQEEDRPIDARGEGISGRVYFTTEEGAQDPEAIDSECSESEGHTWNVTEVVRDSGVQDLSCVFLSPITPSAQPCEAQVNSETAESILASATDSFCRRLDDLECPADEDDEEDVGVSIHGSLATAWTACLASFVGGIGLLLL